MFGVGTSELIIILMIALLILGPKEIPKIARTLGRGMREIQRAKDELRKNIEFEDDTASEIKTELKEIKKAVKNTGFNDEVDHKGSVK